MFIEGFFAALGVMAAIAAVGIVFSIPGYFFMRKKLKEFQEFYTAIQSFNEIANRKDGPIQ